MLKKIIITLLLIIVFVKNGNAQELQTQVETINAFIEEHSEDNRNYYAKINATQGNVYFYNEIQHAMQLTFPVQKIDADNIKITKKGLTFYPKEKGLVVKKQFSSFAPKDIGTAWLNIIKMSKKDKTALQSMMKKFIIDYQTAMK
ncbi:hypothetical protein CSC80_11840 [Maribacter sp. 6B07]|uniref:Uncharacterized protein n=1 Tax=Maribacter dokdonensis TaxID=320912 RepID=A0A1H4R994_9FLAO|nr:MULTISPECIES: hypothetical protein [Maribacter]MDP2527296.1 hypothetical protein [Maribacter dokdonensis]PHN93601.1 hypothetical protein CSC80_11840 [Maribacter sp. 6B07]SEC28396.1 hypothetical protein SAMN05192540_2798 [Maribacter dokdonensis]